VEDFDMKKDYVAPKLTELGDIKEITQSGPNGLSFRGKGLPNSWPQFQVKQNYVGRDTGGVFSVG